MEGKTNYTRSPISQTGAFLRVPKRTKKPTITQYKSSEEQAKPSRRRNFETKLGINNVSRCLVADPSNIANIASRLYFITPVDPRLYCNQLTFQSQSTAGKHHFHLQVKEFGPLLVNNAVRSRWNFNYSVTKSPLDRSEELVIFLLIFFSRSSCYVKVWNFLLRGWFPSELERIEEGAGKVRRLAWVSS